MMPYTRIFSFSAVALALSFAVGVSPNHTPAQPPSPPPKPIAPGSRFGPAIVDKLPTNKAPETSQLSGKVVDTTTVSFGDTHARHLIAWVRTEDDEIRAVDFGAASGKGAVSIKLGDEITVTGQVWPVVQMRKTDMFFASQLKTGHQTLPITRPAPMPGGRLETTQSLTGEVIRTKRVEWRGSDRRELVILLRTDAGKEVLGDLGPTTAFVGTPVRSGSSITLRGQFETVGDKQVFFASEAVVGDKTITIQRIEPSKQSAAPNVTELPKPQRRVLDGVIADISEVPRKEGGKSMLLLLRGADDRYAIADLGDATIAGKYDLIVGDRVTVSGPVTHMQNRPVIIADSLSINGTTHWIKR